MANPLSNEKELYAKITREKIGISPEIWDLLYHRIGDDLTAINLLCRYYYDGKEPVPVAEAGKILKYTRHIKEIVHKIAHVSESSLPFPEIIDDMPLQPVLRDMFTHYIGNDVYLINLIVGDHIDPLDPRDLPLDAVAKILQHTRTIIEFMDKLREATWQQDTRSKSEGTAFSAQRQNPQKDLSKEEIFVKIRELLIKEFGFPEEKIRLETRFDQDLKLDSVDAIRVIMLLEEGFALEIPDNAVAGVLAVKDAVEYLYEQLKKA